MIKKKLKTLVFIPVVGLICFLFYYSYNFSIVQMSLIETNNTSEQAIRKYHFVVIAQNTHDTFWQSVKQTANKEGKAPLHNINTGIKTIVRDDITD